MHHTDCNLLPSLVIKELERCEKLGHDLLESLHQEWPTAHKRMKCPNERYDLLDLRLACKHLRVDRGGLGIFSNVL
jgi:hypothetical protein